jgi:hypothetical protein
MAGAAYSIYIGKAVMPGVDWPNSGRYQATQATFSI